MSALDDDSIFLDPPVPPGNERIPGQELPAPSDPMAVARKLAPMYGSPLLYWRGDFYRHAETHWPQVSKAAIRHWLVQITEAATYAALKSTGDTELRKWAPTTKKINDVLDMLGTGAVFRNPELEEDRVLAFANGVLVGDDERATPHSPERFNLTCLPFDYDPLAICPEWQKFMDSILPGDLDSQAFLQEWFGYVLSGRTDLHKIGVLVGPPRCGKGTIARVLQAMVGANNWVAPTISRMGNQFALASMIGRSLAVVGDVRWNNTKDVAAALETMLTISGGDGITIPRKNIEDWSGRLGVRFMLSSNDAPGSFNDMSGAFASRMVFVEFRKSFLGQEELDLEERLMAELPGIFNWAREGQRRLARTGRFTQSVSVNDLREEVAHGSSPIAAWADDWCSLESHTTTLDALFQSYKEWLTTQDSALSPNKARFGRELRSALGYKGVSVDRTTIDGRKVRVAHGIRVRAGAQIDSSNVVQLFDSA